MKKHRDVVDSFFQSQQIIFYKLFKIYKMDILDSSTRIESRIVFINSFKSYGYREYVVNRYDILEEEEPYHLEVMVRINRCLEQPKKLLRNEAYRYLCAYVHIHRSLDIYGYELPMTLFRWSDRLQNRTSTGSTQTWAIFFFNFDDISS